MARCHGTTTLRLWHALVSVLLSLVVAFKAANMFTGTYSNPKEPRECRQMRGVNPVFSPFFPMRYFYKLPCLGGEPEEET